LTETLGTDRCAQAAPGDRSGRACRAEGEPGPDLDAAAAGIGGCADQGGGADDQQ
jgi:hypothetical protein